MTVGDITTLISATTALVAVVLGPWLTSRFSRHQLISPMREKWIYEFRDSLADFLSSINVACHPDFEPNNKNTFEEFQKVFLLNYRILMMLNPKEPTHAALIAQLGELTGLIKSELDEVNRHKRVKISIQEIIVTSQTVVKEAWDQIAKN